MTYNDDTAGSGNDDTQFQNFWLFVDNIGLLLKHKQTIFSRHELFYTPLPFPVLESPLHKNQGPVRLGHLLLGWTDGALLAPCPNCDGRALITLITQPQDIFTGDFVWDGFCQSSFAAVTGTLTSKQFWRGPHHFIAQALLDYPDLDSYRYLNPDVQFAWPGVHDGPKYSWPLTYVPPKSPIHSGD